MNKKRAPLPPFRRKNSTCVLKKTRDANRAATRGKSTKKEAEMIGAIYRASREKLSAGEFFD